MRRPALRPTIPLRVTAAGTGVTAPAGTTWREAAPRRGPSLPRPARRARARRHASRFARARTHARPLEAALRGANHPLTPAAILRLARAVETVRPVPRSTRGRTPTVDRRRRGDGGGCYAQGPTERRMETRRPACSLGSVVSTPRTTQARHSTAPHENALLSADDLAHSTRRVSRARCACQSRAGEQRRLVVPTLDAYSNGGAPQSARAASLGRRSGRTS
jgi:hypothetical protein